MTLTYDDEGNLIDLPKDTVQVHTGYAITKDMQGRHWKRADDSEPRYCESNGSYIGETLPDVEVELINGEWVEVDK